MKLLRKWWVLLLIVGLGAFLRLYKLNEVPPSLTHDEVAIAYNAYSILKTGRDEYGHFMPLLFRSFDDYKLPGMVYSTVPFVAIFGLNEWGTRLPSALFGIASILVFYGIAKRITEDWKDIQFLRFKIEPALIITLFFTVSSWHINFSRQLFESNGSVFFFLLGTFFVLSFPKKKNSLLFAAIFYAVSVYFYYSVRIILPFIVLSTFITWKKEILKSRQEVIKAALLGGLILLPLLPALLSSGGFARIQTVSVVNDDKYKARIERNTKFIAENPSIVNILLFNRRIAFIESAAENYLVNLNAFHLFFAGTHAGGLLYLFEAPLLLAGFYTLLQSNNKYRWILLAWFLATPLVGAFSTNQPNALRALPHAPFFALLSGVGCVAILSYFKDKRVRTVTAGVFLFIGMAVILKSFTTYLFITPKETSRDFGDGYKQMAVFIHNHRNDYDQFYITGNYWRPYIFLLFWLRYDPAQYQKNGNDQHFDKFTFGQGNFDKGGLDFGDPKLVIKTLVHGKKERTAFLLAPQDYHANWEELDELGTINGTFAKDVFIIARSREDRTKE